MSYTISVSINTDLQFIAENTSAVPYKPGPGYVLGLSSGGFILVQAHEFTAGTGAHVHTEFFDAFGSPIESSGTNTQHLISFTQTSVQGTPAQLTNGNVVILTRDVDSLGFTIESGAGSLVVATTDVTTLVPDALDGTNGNVAALSSGGFVVVYQDPYPPNPTDLDIKAIIYDSVGGAPIPITIDFDSFVEDHPSVCALVGGGFAVAWEAGGGIRYAIYGDDGSVIVPKTDLPAQYLGSINQTPAIVALATGGFELVYASNVLSGIDTAIMRATIEPDGTVADWNLVYDSADYDRLPSVSVLQNGYLAVGSTDDLAGNTNLTLVDLVSGHAMGTIDTSGALSSGLGKPFDISVLSDGRIVAAYTDTAGIIHGTLVSVGTTRYWTGNFENDVMQGDPSQDVMSGFGGGDTLVGGSGDDVLFGGEGNDRLQGDGGFDYVFGDEGDDTIVVNSFADGADYIDGGTGSDTLDLRGVTAAAARVDLLAGNWNLIPKLSFPAGIFGVETVLGTQLGDKISGSAEAETLSGEGGNDLIGGGDNSDRITGGAGADQLTGGLGADYFLVEAQAELAAGESIDGTAEAATLDYLILNDAASYDFSAFTTISNIDQIKLNEDAGGFAVIVSDSMVSTADANRDGTAGEIAINSDFGLSTANGVTIDASALTGINRVVINGSNLSGADVLMGGAGGDYLRAGGGADSILGGGGKDTIIGEGGDDTLGGDAGLDTITGGNGRDLITGGDGFDQLTGGNGNDRFIYMSASEGGDAVTDFSTSGPGNNDSFGFLGAAFGGLAAGLLAGKQFQNSTSATAGTVNVRFLYETDTGILRYDADGSGALASVVIATLQPGAAMSILDIVIL